MTFIILIVFVVVVLLWLANGENDDDWYDRD